MAADSPFSLSPAAPPGLLNGAKQAKRRQRLPGRGLVGRRGRSAVAPSPGSPRRSCAQAGGYNHEDANA